VAVPTANGIQLCQHNCPVAHVAEEFPQLCEAETEAFGRMLATHVMRLATLAHGDGVCTTHIPTNFRNPHTPAPGQSVCATAAPNPAQANALGLRPETQTATGPEAR
jgi:hypothetical protein